MATTLGLASQAADVLTFMLGLHFYRHPNPQRFWFGRIGMIYAALRRLSFLSDSIFARLVRKFAELGMFGFLITWLSRFHPDVLGLPASLCCKGLDGKLSPIIQVLGFPFRSLEEYQYRKVAERVAKMSKPMLDKYNLVISGEKRGKIYVGMFPGFSNPEEGFPRDVDIVLDMTNEFSEPEWVVEDREYIVCPTWDQYIPQDKEYFIQCIEHIAAQRKSSVYIHCAFGVSRSAVAAVCLLIKRGDARTIEEAIKMIKASRPAIELRPMHLEFLKDVVPRLTPSNDF